jgi:hypothetical protein
MKIRNIIKHRTFRSLPLLAVIFFGVCVVEAALSVAQNIAGSFAHVHDSDGTVPKRGATVEITFTGGTKGSVKLLATQPGETVTDTGTYSIKGNRITIHFKEVEWEAKNQPFQFDRCTLILPFKALSSSPGPGTSTWQKQDPECGQRQPGSISERAPAGKGHPQKLTFSPFSADEIITEGKQHRRVKIYATEKALRGEGEENGQKSITIIRFDRNVMWTLVPQKKSYAETSLNFGKGITSLQEGSIEPGCSVVGEEQVGGYRCVKEVCRFTIVGKDYSETRWASKELGGLIIKYTDGVQTLELENIKLGPQDPVLFEIPAGYQKKSR